MSASADDTTSVEKTGVPVVESKVTFTKEQQAEIDRLLQEATKPLKDEAAKYRVEKKTAIEAEMIKNGEAVKLAEARGIELEKLQAEKKIADEKLAKIEADTKKELLEKIPESMRDDYKDFGLDALRTVSKHLAIIPPNGNSQGNERGASSNGAIPTVKTQAEMYELMISNPTAYKKLIEQK